MKKVFFKEKEWMERNPTIDTLFTDRNARGRLVFAIAKENFDEGCIVVKTPFYKCRERLVGYSTNKLPFISFRTKKDLDSLSIVGATNRPKKRIEKAIELIQKFEQDNSKISSNFIDLEYLDPQWKTPKAGLKVFKINFHINYFKHLPFLACILGIFRALLVEKDLMDLNTVEQLFDRYQFKNSAEKKDLYRADHDVSYIRRTASFNSTFSFSLLDGHNPITSLEVIKRYYKSILSSKAKFIQLFCFAGKEHSEKYLMRGNSLASVLCFIRGRATNTDVNRITEQSRFCCKVMKLFHR